MSAAAAEHRGWKISTDYHPHYLDDATYDVAEDEVETGRIGWVVFVLVLLAAAVIGLWLLGKYLEPPALFFPPPRVEIISPKPPVGMVLPSTSGLSASAWSSTMCTISGSVSQP